MWTPEMRFFGQHDDEKLMFWTRKHWIVVAPKLGVIFLLFSLVLAIGTLFISKNGLALLPDWIDEYLFLTLFFLLLFLFHLFFLTLFAYLFNFFIITDSRILEVTKTAIIYDEKESIDLHQVRDVKAEKNGFLSICCHFGDINLTLSSLGDSKTLRSIPHPLHIQERLTQIKHTYLEKRLQTSALEREDLVPFPGDEKNADEKG